MSPVTSIDPTSLGSAEKNVESSVVAWVAAANEKLKDGYLNGAFANWSLNYHAGKIPWNATPPLPPRRFVVNYFADPTRPDAFWAYPDQSGPAVCDVPSFTREPQPQSELPQNHDCKTALFWRHRSRRRESAAQRRCGSESTYSIDAPTPPVTAADGVRGIFGFLPSPFGGWYYLIQRM